MAYNLAYLRQRVFEDKLDDDSIDPGIIDNFLNDTQRDIFNTYELPSMEKIFEGVLAQGGYQFSFPDDYSILESMIITDDDDYQTNITESYLPFRQFNERYPVPGNNSAGVPYNWTTFANKLFIDKPTDKQYTLRMYYLKTPVDMEGDTDTPTLPSAFEEVLVLGAYLRCLNRNEDFDLASQVAVDYQRKLTALVSRATKRQSGAPVTITQPARSVYPRSSGRR